MDYRSADKDAYDKDHLFPFGYRELLPYYEWVEETLPIQTAPMTLKEEIFFRGAAMLGLPVETSKNITRAAYRPQENAILQPGGTAGRTDNPNRLTYPSAQGCTFCGHCAQGCYMPLAAPINLKAKRSTSVSYIPMAITADRWSRRGKAITLISDAFATRVGMDSTGNARSVT